MPTTAFICAMPMEMKPLSKALGLTKGERDGLTVRTGTIGGDDVVAIVTGMGPELATRETEKLLATTTPDRVVVVGITGAVDDVIPIGTLVRPEVVIDAATESEHRPQQLGTGEAKGAMWTTDRMTPASELAALRERGVICLDMETAAIAACCEQRDIPWSVFRAISDRATDGSIDDEVFHLSHQDGSPDPKAIARFAAKHPVRMAKMAGLAKGAKLATERAAAAAIDAVRALT